MIFLSSDFHLPSLSGKQTFSGKNNAEKTKANGESLKVVTTKKCHKNNDDSIPDDLESEYEDAIVTEPIASTDRV